MKVIIAITMTMFAIVSGAVAAPGDRSDFYAEGHNSYTGGNGSTLWGQ